jgi:GxxExxY protein
MEAEVSKLKHADLTEKIIGVYYEVYNELGYGFLESVYHNAMTIALRGAGLTAEAQVPIPVVFRGEPVGDFKADLLVEGKLILELKAVKALESMHEAQLFHYLRATDIEVGLVLNFGAPRPQLRRLLLDNSAKLPKRSAAKSGFDLEA